MAQLVGRGCASLLLSQFCEGTMGVFQQELHLHKHFMLAALVFNALCLHAVLLLTTPFQMNDLMIEHLADGLPTNRLTECLMAFWLTDRLTD